jgi:predicted nucleic acid-binding protein
LELDRVPEGARIFVDAPVFIYHFTGVSPACRRFLARCERAEVQGVTSVTVVAEVTHRLMMIEAVRRGLVSAGNIATKLRKKPEAIRALHLADEQAARIPMMGIEVRGLDLHLLIAAAALRRRHGLMTNDAIIAATARGEGIERIATADGDFERVDELTVFTPVDLPRG